VRSKVERARLSICFRVMPQWSAKHHGTAAIQLLTALRPNVVIARPARAQGDTRRTECARCAYGGGEPRYRHAVERLRLAGGACNASLYGMSIRPAPFSKTHDCSSNTPRIVVMAFIVKQRCNVHSTSQSSFVSRTPPTTSVSSSDRTQPDANTIVISFFIVRGRR
jgi:hypothetical protein